MYPSHLHFNLYLDKSLSFSLLSFLIQYYHHVLVVLSFIEPNVCHWLLPGYVSPAMDTQRSQYRGRHSTFVLRPLLRRSFVTRRGGCHSAFNRLTTPPLPRIKENYIIVRVFAVYVFGNVEETRQLEIYARPLLLPFCLVDIRRVTRWKKEKKMMIGYQFPRSYSNKVVISRFNQQSYDDCKLWLQRCISLRVAV